MKVADASLIGAAFFNEIDSTLARQFLTYGPPLIAPDLLRIEIASIAAKKVWRSEVSIEVGRRALEAISTFVDEFVSSESLALRAFHLAATHRFSAYDALYLALAETRATCLVTLDQKLIDRAQQLNLDHLVEWPQV